MALFVLFLFAHLACFAVKSFFFTPKQRKKCNHWHFTVYYSGKKKCHTVKSQIIADIETRLIYDVEESPGSVHDFTLCKETLLLVMILAVMILADNSYQGIQEYHEWSLIPITALAVKKEWMTKLVEDVNRAAIFRLRDSIRNLKIAALFVQCQLSPARTVRRARSRSYRRRRRHLIGS